MDNLNFQVLDIDFSAGVRLHRWWAGITDRKNMLRSFCHNAGIDYPPRTGKKYSLPKEYRIDTKEIGILGQNRDRVILDQWDRYVTVKQEVNARILEKSGEMKDIRDAVAYEERLMDEMTEEEKVAKDNLVIIDLQNRIVVQATKIENRRRDETEIATELEKLNKKKVSNSRRWNKQVEGINLLLAMNIAKYVTSATKRIARKLQYADFIYEPPMPGRSVQNAMNEEENEK